MTDQINRFIRDTCPSLAPQGFNNHPERFGEDDARQVGICLRWLDQFAIPTKTIRTRYSSYALKHAVERWSGEYIGNGCFICAALLAGYRYKAYDTPNANFNFTVKKGAGGWW